MHRSPGSPPSAAKVPISGLRVLDDVAFGQDDDAFGARVAYQCTGDHDALAFVSRQRSGTGGWSCPVEVGRPALEDVLDFAADLCDLDRSDRAVRRRGSRAREETRIWSGAKSFVAIHDGTPEGVVRACGTSFLMITGELRSGVRRTGGASEQRQMIEDAARLYERGLTIRQVAQRFGCSYGVMRRLLSERTTLRNRGGVTSVDLRRT
ncbi:helix-turn-helix domain-containing protein [Actinomadura sp. DC4]|uniref:helix-turn-helix domain-containing protein n=1 Tax=Actinomadura sp. DC4 TaxID=3055069 RepID=UPI00339D44F7